MDWLKRLRAKFSPSPKTKFYPHAREILAKRFIAENSDIAPENRHIPEPFRSAHSSTWKNRLKVEASALCGCFYCGQVFPSLEIIEWHDEDLTAFCPKCGIDAIIPDNVGYPLTKEFLLQMNQYWFGDGFVDLKT